MELPYSWRGTFSLYLFFAFLHGSCSQFYPTLYDGGTATISLLNYNTSDPDGESVEFVYTLLPNTSANVLVTNVPGDAYFVLIQAHSFLENVSLSYYAQPTRNSSANGTNVGLWNVVSTTKFNNFIHYWNNTRNTTLMIAVQAYGNKTPIPGGCNMEFPVETAPYLVTTYDSSTVRVEFAPAAPPISVLTWLGIEPGHSCSLKKPQPVTHDTYRLYMPERDFSVDMYFSALQRLMTIGRIKQYANQISAKPMSPPTRRLFAAYPGTGSATVVVAKTLTDAAVYVPSFTYACDVREEDNTCAVLTTTFSKILCAMILFVGLVAMTVSHRFFLMEMFLLGLFVGGLLVYLLEGYMPSQIEILAIALGFGLIVGCGLVLVWTCCAAPLIAITFAAGSLGYLIAAYFFFLTLDLIDGFSSDINYWIPFACIVTVTIVLLSPLAEKACVMSTSVLGSYAVIIPIDYYIGTNLRYILVNSIRRATVPDFRLAIIDPPIQVNDYILGALWGALAVVGFISQMFLIRHKAPFPAPSWNLRRFRAPRPPVHQTPSERTPLISNVPVQSASTFR